MFDTSSIFNYLQHFSLYKDQGEDRDMKKEYHILGKTKQLYIAKNKNVGKSYLKVVKDKKKNITTNKYGKKYYFN